ncbi:MAG: hypothetical protein J2P55_00675 [Rhizobiales bacterium]|nr:hypothetical protein [Hyphomicrobiales bacterium]
MAPSRAVRHVTARRTEITAPAGDQAAHVSALAGIEREAKVTHDADLRSLEESRIRLEINRTNLQRALRLVDGQIEAYDRMIQIARSRVKEFAG